VEVYVVVETPSGDRAWVIYEHCDYHGRLGGVARRRDCDIDDSVGRLNEKVYLPP
jgi:hypothetical protein